MSIALIFVAPNISNDSCVWPQLSNDTLWNIYFVKVGKRILSLKLYCLISFCHLIMWSNGLIFHEKNFQTSATLKRPSLHDLRQYIWYKNIQKYISRVIYSMFICQSYLVRYIQITLRKRPCSSDLLTLHSFMALIMFTNWVPIVHHSEIAAFIFYISYYIFM